MSKENLYYTDSIKRELAVGVKVTARIAAPIIEGFAPIVADAMGGRVKNWYWYMQSQKEHEYGK